MTQKSGKKKLNGLTLILARSFYDVLKYPPGVQQIQVMEH